MRARIKARCGVIVPVVLLLICLNVVYAGDPETFTIDADLMTFTNESDSVELLSGVIKARDVRAENVTISDGGVIIKARLIESPFMTLEVTTITIVGLGVFHLKDLPVLLSGEEVTWEDVTIETKRLETNAMRYEEMVITL